MHSCNSVWYPECQCRDSCQDVIITDTAVRTDCSSHVSSTRLLRTNGRFPSLVCLGIFHHVACKPMGTGWTAAALQHEDIAWGRSSPSFRLQDTTYPCFARCWSTFVAQECCRCAKATFSRQSYWFCMKTKKKWTYFANREIVLLKGNNCLHSWTIFLPASHVCK